ncbi:short chain dehydrogenase [compost metagenome]
MEDGDFLAPFWEQPMVRWDLLFNAGLRAQMVSSRYAMSTFFLEQKKGLLINTGHTTESVEYIGRAVVALASDPQVHLKAGQLWEAGSLAEEYGFTDVDGRRMPPFRV